MQDELRALNPAINVEILGVNQIGADSSFAISLTTAGRDIPWLQDTSEARVWESWDVAYRDVRILDADNELAGVFNLTANDLSIPANYEALKQMFLQAAQGADTDADGLLDAWELRHFQNLAQDAAGDPDEDGFENITELAFGTGPNEALFKPAVSYGFDATGRMVVSFRRWAGGQFNYFVEASSDLENWTGDSAVIAPLRDPRNLFDGTGAREEVHILSQSAESAPAQFIRVRALPR